jgi:dipeptidyl aminopeptidase/acylaminoacyl peptidase
VTIAAPAELPEAPRPGWTSESAADRSTDGVDEHAFEVPPSFFADARRHDPVAAARAVRCPWLVIHGAADDVVPVRHAELFVAACPCATPSTHPRAGHRFQAAAHRRWLVGRAIGFVADVLGGRSDRR